MPPNSRPGAPRKVLHAAVLAILALTALLIVVGIIGAVTGGGSSKETAQVAAESTEPSTTPTLTSEQSAYVASVATAQAVQAEQTRISAQQTFAARPTSTPIPLPYKLALISKSCTSEYGYTTCEGFVENLTGTSLENVAAVIYLFDENDVPVSSEDALIEYDPLLPYQRSPWKVIFRYNPGFKKWNVGFKELFGGLILTRPIED